MGLLIETCSLYCVLFFIFGMTVLSDMFNKNRCKFIVNEDLYYIYRREHWIILKHFTINLLKKL